MSSILSNELASAATYQGREISLCEFAALTRAQNVLFIVVAAGLLLACGRIASAQPLLREGEPSAEEQTESDAEALQRQELARRRAQLEEERQLKLQEELMRIRGEQMQAEQQEIKRRDTMMRYALIIAIAVIATTLLIAFARSRASGEGRNPEVPP